MKIVFFTALIIILFFLLIRFLEYRSLYFPFKEIEATPADIGLDYENIQLTTRDGVKLTGWFIPDESPRAFMLFCHGNGGNISHRLEKIRILNSLDLSILIFDYRGYGKSDGRPSETGLYADAEAAYEYLITERKIPPEKIIVYGESLGGAVAIDLASKLKPGGGVIVEDTFTSSRDMGGKLFPFIPAFVYKSRFDSLEKIQDISAPKLIFHSTDDDIIPFEHGRRLFDKASDPKEFLELRGGHNDAFLVSEDVYMSGIDSFMKNLLSRQ